MNPLTVKSLRGYAGLLAQVKSPIRRAQTNAILSANAEMIRMYWDVGNLVLHRQQQKGWGTSVIPRLARDLRAELSEVKGFSERNIGYMVRFAREYALSRGGVDGSEANTSLPILQHAAAKLPAKSMKPILQRAAAKLSAKSVKRISQQAAAKLAADNEMNQLMHLATQLPWFHNVILMERVKDLTIRRWYMEQALTNGWSRDLLLMMIEAELTAWGASDLARQASRQKKSSHKRRVKP